MASVLIVVGHREGSQGASHAGVTEWAWNTPVAHLIVEELAQLGHDAQVVFRDNVRGGYSKLPAKLKFGHWRCMLASKETRCEQKT